MKIFLQLFLLNIILLVNARAANFNKVLVIVFENSDFGSALKQPYFNSLTKEGALLTNYFALTHPSQPNYIAMISGSTVGVRNDSPVNLDRSHLGDILEQAGKSWKVYAQDYPGKCFLGETSGRYARKHIPFISFNNVQKNPSRCAKIVNANEFLTDFNNQNLPDYSLYVPNLDNDGHDTGVGFGDKWLKTNFDKIIHSPKMPKDLLVILTFDEGNKIGNNKIYTLLLGANIKAGATSNKKYNTYSLLKTIEDDLRLASLKQNDMSAILIDDIWK